MTAQQLSDALHSLWPHCDPDQTVDQVIEGDPEQEAAGVAVCWMPLSSTLREAASRGLNTVVAHEPTYYDHFELRRQPGHRLLEEAKAAKAELVRELGITIIRCHDVWDALPERGVPFEWGRFLGLGEPAASRRYLNLYRITPMRAWDAAQHIAARTATAGQSTVHFYGDPDRMVEIIGIGTGCCSEALELYEFGGDLAVTVDDIARAWIIGAYCCDTGRPLVVVNHGVSEDCAMDSLAEAVRGLVPGVPVEVLRQGASFREVRAAPGAGGG